MPLATIGNIAAATTANINRRRTITARLVVVMAFPPPPEPDRLWALAQPSVSLCVAGKSVLLEPTPVNRKVGLGYVFDELTAARARVMSSAPMTTLVSVA